MSSAEEVHKADQRQAFQDELVTQRQQMDDDAVWAPAVMSRLSDLSPRELTILAARLVNDLAEARTALTARLLE